MKRNGALLAAAIILSLALIYCGKNISRAISYNANNTASSQSILINEEEAAKYLGIKVTDFRDLFREQLKEKQNMSAYPTYKFIPYMVIKGDRYFTKSELDKWVEFNMNNK